MIHRRYHGHCRFDWRAFRPNGWAATKPIKPEWCSPSRHRAVRDRCSRFRPKFDPSFRAPHRSHPRRQAARRPCKFTNPPQLTERGRGVDDWPPHGQLTRRWTRLLRRFDNVLHGETRVRPGMKLLLQTTMRTPGMLPRQTRSAKIFAVGAALLMSRQNG